MWERTGKNRIDAERVAYSFRCTDCGAEAEVENGRPDGECSCARAVRAGEVVTYTTAEAAYDWFGTHEVDGPECRDKRGRTVRRVAGPEERVEEQRARYGSGLHLAVDEAEWRKLVAYGLATEVAPAAK